MSNYHLDELARTLFEESGNALFLKDTSFHIVAANRCYCEAVGRTEAEVLGKTDFDFYPPALAEKYRADDRRVLSEGRRLELEEENLVRGQLRRVRVIKTPVRDRQSRIVGVLGMFWDVTEHHALEEQLRQAQKMEAVGQLAGGLAHDFNNLLTVILGNLTLLQKAVAANDPQRPLVEAAEHAAWRAATLTRQLLGFSRRAVLHPEPLNTNHTVDEVVGLLNHTIDPRITLQTRAAADLWLVQADPNQMSQVLLNLCLNARDAVQPLLDGAPTREAVILLETANLTFGPVDLHEHIQARCGDFVRLRVGDNGVGIAPEAQAHIFEPFFTTKQPGQGTGLGLAMVFGIIQQHNGWIECHSAPGEGTRFDIYLPRYHTVVAPSTGRALLRKPLGGHETILLADDQAPIRHLGRNILERLGYRVLLAEDGEDALDVYQREQPRIDLVILDLTMPRLSGRDALRRLLEINPEVRVLFASGYSAEHLSAEDHEHIYGFINKPFRPEDLAFAVRAALDCPCRVPAPVTT